MATPSDMRLTDASALPRPAEPAAIMEGRGVVGARRSFGHALCPRGLPASLIVMLLSFNVTAIAAKAADDAASSGTAASALRVVDSDGTAVPGAVIFAPAKDRAALPTDIAVDQRDKRFVPLVSVVAPGATVSFPNSDDIRHHVYSFSDGNSFERKLYRADEAEPVIFDEEGVVALGCNIHDNMQAFVLVTDRPVLGVTGSDGVAAGITTQAGETLEVWHPLLNAAGDALALTVTAGERGPRLELPMRWQDPQERRSTTELEKLLREFSRGAP